MFKTFVLALLIFGILQSTVFFKEPSCCTTDFDLWEFAPSFFVSIICAGLIVLIYEDVKEIIKTKRKEK